MAALAALVSIIYSLLDRPWRSPTPKTTVSPLYLVRSKRGDVTTNNIIPISRTTIRRNAKRYISSSPSADEERD
jgi:hypothetical protein